MTIDVDAEIRALDAAGLLRTLRVFDSGPAAHVTLDGRQVLALCSNDYLGLAGHPMVCDAAAQAARRWGAGAGASRLVWGTLALHRQLEDELAEFKRSAACVLFGSGYLANTGVIAALARPDGVVCSDALNHASIVDGCRLARAQTLVYRHRDLDTLEHALEQAAGRPALIVTDAVFSMDGDLAPLPGIVDLAQRHRARVVVDEAHATGVLGPSGRGLVAQLGLEHEVDVVIGTLGKALGSYGAFACATPKIVEYLVNRARTLIYSTAPPPSAVAAARMALALLRDTPDLVERLHRNARALRDELSDSGIAVERSWMPIVPLVLGDPDVATSVSEEALRRGVHAQAIRPPTVPDGTSRLRLVATAAHREADLRAAARMLSALVHDAADAGPTLE